MALSNTGNNTRANLREAIKQQLNDPNNEFWSNAALNQYIQEAMNSVHSDANRKDADGGLKVFDFTYTASAESVDTAITENLGRVSLIEDRTDTQPGPMWQATDNYSNIYMYNQLPNDTSRYFDRTTYKIIRKEAGVDASRAITWDIFAAPPPTSDRSLRLHFQPGPPDMSNDTYLSGLLPEAEAVVVAMACVLAKLQEVGSVSQDWKDELDRRQKRLDELQRPLNRGPKRIRYVEDGYY